MDRVRPNHDKSRRELQLSAEAALLCKDCKGCDTCAAALFDEQRARILPASSLSNVVFGEEGWHAHAFLLRRCLVRVWYRSPLLTGPPFTEPIGTAVVFQSSSIFSSDHRQLIVINILTENWQHSAVSVPPLSTQSVDLQKAIDINLCVCIQQLELHMKPDTNNSARKLYIFRTISNAAATELNTFVAGKEIGFLLTRTYYFLVTLFLFFPAFSC